MTPDEAIRAAQMGDVVDMAMMRTSPGGEPLGMGQVVMSGRTTRAEFQRRTLEFNPSADFFGVEMCDHFYLAVAE